jgi:hypothetical protein
MRSVRASTTDANGHARALRWRRVARLQARGVALQRLHALRVRLLHAKGNGKQKTVSE